MKTSAFARLVLAESIHAVRHRWLAIAFGALLLATVGSMWQGRHDFRAQASQYDSARHAREQAQVRANLVALGRGAEPGLRILRPPSPGVIVIPGEDWQTPAAWELQPAGADALAPYPSALRRFHLATAWNLAGFVRIWAAALALLLGLGCGLSDRIPGWWSAIALWPDARAWLSARLIAGFNVMIAGVALWWTVATITLWTFADAQMPSRDLWLAALPALLYLVGWWALGLASAWMAASAVRAALYAAGLWIAGAVFAPALPVFVADTVISVPSLESFQEERQQTYADALRTAELEVGRRLGQLLPDPSATGPDLESAVMSAFPQVEAQWRTGFADARAVVTASDRARHDLQARQKRWATAMGLLLPGASLDAVLAELAGTGASMREAWHDAAARFHLALQPTLFDDRPTANLRIVMGNRAALHGIPRHRPPAIGSLPDFLPPERSGPWRSGQTLSLVAGLFAWAGLTGSLAWRAGRAALSDSARHRSRTERHSIG